MKPARKTTLSFNNINRILANYMVWHLIKPLVNELSKHFRDASLELMKAEKGVEGNAPQWKTCVVKTDAVMGFATGYLYIKERSGKISKKEVRRFKTSTPWGIIWTWRLCPFFTFIGRLRPVSPPESSVISELVGSLVRVPNRPRFFLLYASANNCS